MLVLIEGLKTYAILLVFYLAIELFIVRCYKKNGIVMGKGFLIGWQLFVCLCILILQITGASGINNVGQNGNLISMDEINLVPFTGGRFDMTANMIMFIPLGVAIPLLWKKDCSLIRTAALGFLFSLFIEISQLFNFRATDVDDLIMNTMGSVIGYLIYLLLFRKVTLFQVQNLDASGTLTKNGGFYSLFIIALFHFFIGSPLLSFIWAQVYGY